MAVLRVRSNVPQLGLLVFALVLAVVWYRSSRESSLRSWYDHASWLIQTEHSNVPVESHEKHPVRPDGLLGVNMAGRHPMWDLMQDAERQWEEMKARQSKTLAQAVAEYTRRNGYAPPAGFDLWWEFTQKHNVRLVDEFDQINYDITPYLAMSPATFRARTSELSDPSRSYHINVTNGQTGQYGPDWWDGDQRQLGSMVMGVSSALPDLAIHGSQHARADQWIGSDLRRAADVKARAGEYFTEDELRYFERLERNEHRDRKNACLPDDPIFTAPPAPDTPTFVASHLKCMSPCDNAGAHRASPLLFAHRASAPRLTPHFVFSKHRPDSGLLLPTNTWNFYDPLLFDAHSWEERRGDGVERLFWRGRAHGWSWYKGMMSRESGITWRDGGRPKLALAFGANTTRGQEVEVLLEDEGELVIKRFDRAWLNERWMDIGLTGPPIACNTEDGTCDEMRDTPMWKEPVGQHKENRKKFTVDLDENGWSRDFQQKLSWGTVVFKATIYPEWNTQWLIPYYHYIPIQPDYSDVYNIMAFFLGDPERGQGGHEDMAEKISRHAIEFSKDYWRWQDMQAYLFRLLLEYARLGNDDREAASFRF